MFYWSKFGFLDMMGLFVGAASLIMNALNPRKHEISYSIIYSHFPSTAPTLKAASNLF